MYILYGCSDLSLSLLTSDSSINYKLFWMYLILKCQRISVASYD